MSAPPELKPVTARAVAAFNRHDSAGFVAEFAEGGTFRDPMQDHGLTSEEIRAYINDVLTAFPDSRTEEQRIVPAGDTTVVEATFRATDEAAFDGYPSTRESVAVPMVSLVTVSDDGIASWRDDWNRGTFFEQIGFELPHETTTDP